MNFIPILRATLVCHVKNRNTDVNELLYINFLYKFNESVINLLCFVILRVNIRYKRIDQFN